MRRTGIAIVLVLCFAAAPALGESLRFLPQRDPAYRFLDKAYAMGWLSYLPQVRPYTASQVLDLLEDVEDQLGAPRSGERSKDLAVSQLATIRDRLEGNQFHVLSTTFGDGYHASIDFPLYVTGNTRANAPSDSFLTVGPGAEGSLSLGQALFLRTNFFYGASLATWEIDPFRKFHFPRREDYAVYHYYLSRGEDGFGHQDQLGHLHQPGETDLFFWMNFISQTSVDFGLGTISFARDSLSWGPSPVANLALSGTSAPYEHLSLIVPLGGRGTFAWTTGFLQDYTGSGHRQSVEKLVAVHRLEYHLLDWLLASIYESVVYGNRFEIGYLNPLTIYQIAEVQGGDLDNKFGGFDIVARVPPVKAYFSFLLDDWDFGHLFNPTYYHNEWGAILGIQASELIPALTLQAEYIRLSHWTYTHRADFSEEGNNYNRYKHLDKHLGHFLSPNSHMVYVQGIYDVSPVFTVDSSFWFTQNGGGGYQDGTYDRGDIDNPPDWAFERTLDSWPNNVFLDGIVETNVDWTLGARYRFPYFGASIGASYSVEYTTNLDKVEGADRWDHFVELSGTWTMY
jgi:hypothetical protein